MYNKESTGENRVSLLEENFPVCTVDIKSTDNTCSDFLFLIVHNKRVTTENSIHDLASTGAK